MKTKINSLILSIVSVILCSFILFACDDDGDTTAPAINLIAPANGAVLKIGADLHFDAEFSDNESLQSYKIEIHENMSNPHDHTSSLRNDNGTKYFSFQQTWDDINGLRNKKVHHHHIVIPQNATPGNYHLIVYCTDSAGNESYVASNITLSHDATAPEH